MGILLLDQPLHQVVLVFVHVENFLQVEGDLDEPLLFDVSQLVLGRAVRKRFYLCVLSDILVWAVEIVLFLVVRRLFGFGSCKQR